jgi:hypothetical protein
LISPRLFIIWDIFLKESHSGVGASRPVLIHGVASHLPPLSQPRDNHFSATKFHQRLASQIPWYLPYIDVRCQKRMGGNVEIHEYEIPGLEDAGSPQSMRIYEAIEITNDVVPYSFLMTNSTFQNPQLILIPCQSLSQSLSLESITLHTPYRGE